jgi:hypothetical protein
MDSSQKELFGDPNLIFSKNNFLSDFTYLVANFGLPEPLPSEPKELIAKI